MSDTRKYPCEAVVVVGKGVVKEDPLVGKKVTVLTPYKFESCCQNDTHRVELPVGFPDPPEHCPTWMMSPENLMFEDEGEKEK